MEDQDINKQVEYIIGDYFCDYDAEELKCLIDNWDAYQTKLKASIQEQYDAMLESEKQEEVDNNE